MPDSSIFDTSQDRVNDRLQRRMESRVASAMDRLIEREGGQADIVMFAACALGAAHFSARDPDGLNAEFKGLLYQFFREEADRWNPLAVLSARPPA